MLEQERAQKNEIISSTIVSYSKYYLISFKRNLKWTKYKLKQMKFKIENLKYTSKEYLLISKT